jgi:hypothetical protein
MTKCSMLTSELAAQGFLRDSGNAWVLQVDHMFSKEMCYVLLAATHNTSLARYACENVTKSGIAAAAQGFLRDSGNSAWVLQVDHMFSKEMCYVLLAATHNTSLTRYACENVTKSGIAAAAAVVVVGRAV